MLKVNKSIKVCEALKFTVYQDDLLYPDEKVRPYYYLQHNGAAAIIPQDKQGKIYLVKQYRYPMKIQTLEFPSGTIDGNEDPLTCAQREIREETGFAARDWHYVGSLNTSPSYSTEVQHCYVAKDLYESPLPADEEESIEVVSYSIEDVENLILAGKITELMTISSFYLAKAKNLLS